MPDTLLKPAAVGVATAGALVVALAAAFLVPLRIGDVRFPLSILIVVLGNLATIQFAHRVGRTRWGVLVPAAAWFIATLVLGGGRPEGDVILSNGWVSMATLLFGTATLTVAAVTVVNGIDLVSVIRPTKHGTTSKPSNT